MRRLWIGFLFLVMLVALGGTAAADPIKIINSGNFSDAHTGTELAGTKFGGRTLGNNGSIGDSGCVLAQGPSMRIA